MAKGFHTKNVAKRSIRGLFAPGGMGGFDPNMSPRQARRLKDKLARQAREKKPQ